MHLVLASSSPRRKELLEGLGVSFEVIQSDVDESFDDPSCPESVVRELAHRKALSVAKRIQDAAHETLVIGADTIVVHNGNILGKPRDELHAVAMLQTLQGDEHEVRTAVSVVRVSDFYTRTAAECTRVKFGPLTDNEIRTYVATGEPMDKAGAYGIQKIGALLVEGINGDYFNVVGLPLRRTALLLREFGVDIWQEASPIYRGSETKHYRL